MEQAKSPAKIEQLATFARIAKAVALLCFFLPWVTVSCAGRPFVSASGMRLAIGRVATHNPMSGAMETHPGSVQIAVILALLLLALALILSFSVSRRTAAKAGIAGSAAAAALIAWEVLVHVPQRFEQGLRESPPQPGGFGQTFDSSMNGLIRVEPLAGFWLTLAVLATAVAINWMILQRASESGGPAPPETNSS